VRVDAPPLGGWEASIAKTILMKKTKIFLLMMIAMLWMSISYAQAPDNDNCAGAIDLGSTVGTYTCIQYDVDNATDGAMGSCAFNQEDVWYKFVAIDDVMVFEYCANQNVWDENLTLYSGTCGSLTEIQCNSVSAGFGFPVYENLTAGETYYLLIDFN